MKHPVRSTFLVAASVSALGVASGPASADTIRIRSTSDTVDAGLVDGLLKPGYQKAQPGDTLTYTGEGTQKALDNGVAGLADVVITHAPTAEKTFQDGGYSLEGPGRALFYSDYVIVGPKSDPAGVATDAPHDAVKAFEDIATSGTAGTATFVSRGENSGTNIQEQLMWHLTGSGVVKQPAKGTAAAQKRDEPWDGTGTAGTGGGYPTWYRKTGQLQLLNLQAADVCKTSDFPNGGCYTIVDRGTYNRAEASGSLTNLKVVSEDNDGAARGGKDLLINPFSAYIVNDAKLSCDKPRVNVAAATRFLDYLTSKGFQDAVDTFPSATNPAFRQDAYPAVSIDTPLPPTAMAGGALSVALTFTNRQPGTPAVSGMPVQLQASTDGGTTWVDAGSPVNTDATGKVTLTTTATTTARYRVSLGRFAATSWNAFSPSTQDLGTVTVAGAMSSPTAFEAFATPAATPAVAPRAAVARADASSCDTPPVTTTPATTTPATTTAAPTTPAPAPTATTPAVATPAKKADRTAAKATKVTSTRRRVTLRINEAATVKVTLARRVVERVRKNGRVRNVVSYRRTKTLSVEAKKAGTLRLTWKHAIRAGIYRVTIRSVDTAGNVRTQTRRITVKP